MGADGAMKVAKSAGSSVIGWIHRCFLKNIVQFSLEVRRFSFSKESKPWNSRVISSSDLVNVANPSI